MGDSSDYRGDNFLKQPYIKKSRKLIKWVGKVIIYHFWRQMIGISTARSECLVIREEIKSQLESIGQSDILIGIPSYNNVQTIGRVVQAARAGLAKYFPESKAVLVNSDGGSMDGTLQAAAEASVDLKSIRVSHRVHPLHKIMTPYHGMPGKDSAFQLIFEIAQALRVKACAVVSADLKSITPEWIELLLQAILRQGYDFVVPYYLRHKYDGTITNGVVYPLIRALYGKRIRQPVGGDFGFSGELISYYLTKDVWGTDVARYGIDIWMTTTAIARNCKICQAYLGTRIHDSKGPAADLSAMLFQVVGSVFTLIEESVELWRKVKGSESVPLVGFKQEAELEPVQVSVGRMINAFALGLREFLPIWGDVLSKEVIADLEAIHPKTRELKFPDDLWVRVIYEFALAAHRKTMLPEHLLKSFTPLYLGRVASFILQTEQSSYGATEKAIEKLCLAFEQQKPYLIERWNHPVEHSG
jgi:hypothetical protein